MQVSGEGIQCNAGFCGLKEEAWRDRSFKVGLCPTSNISVFVNTFHLEEMFSFEWFYSV